MEILKLLYTVFGIREKKEIVRKGTQRVIKVHYRRGYELYERAG